jgi:Holliday junction DNA helicase RuvB
MAQHYLAEGIWNHNTGKTTLAQIIAREINRPIHFQMGQSLTSPGRVGDVLLSLKAGDILFIDEVHGLRPICQETLYRAMEDGVYIPIAKAGSPVVKPIHLPPFTLMGATTDIWGLLPPMLQRFKVSIRLKRLSADELAQAMLGRAVRAGLVLTPPAATMIGERSLGTPRLAIRLLDGCLATAKAQGKAEINAEIVTMTCRLLEIDRLGLDDDAQKYLGFLLDAGNDPVRVNVLASRLEGLSRLTLERRIEPDLIFLGLIDKKEKGRVLTAAGREHLREIK